MNAKTLLFLSLLITTGAARAASTAVELTAGIGYGTPQHNGTWYQKGFPHQLHTATNTWSIGLRTDLTEHFAVHADVYRFGTHSSDAQAVTHDALYDPQSPTHCTAACPPLAHFEGRGWTGGMRLLADFHTAGDWQSSFLIGPILYRGTWTVNVPDWFPTEPAPGGYTRGPLQPVHIKSVRWVVSGAAGFRVTHRRQFAELMFYRDGATLQRTAFYPPIWRSHWVLSYGFTF